MIDPAHYGLVEMAFTGAIVLGFLFWQLWTVRHVKLGDPPKRKKPDVTKDQGNAGRDMERRDPPA